MPINVSKEQIRAARQVDLYEFLTNRHNGSFIREGRSIRPRNNHSISIKEGYAGYMDFATNEGGNPIEFLVNHMGYRFPDAVLALTGGTGAARAERPSRTGRGMSRRSFQRLWTENTKTSSLSLISGGASLWKRSGG